MTIIREKQVPVGPVVPVAESVFLELQGRHRFDYQGRWPSIALSLGSSFV